MKIVDDSSISDNNPHQLNDSNDNVQMECSLNSEYNILNNKHVLNLEKVKSLNVEKDNE